MRQLDDWIKAYLDYTQYQESPELFHKWVAIGVLSSVLERNIWLPQGEYFNTYPNLYIMLVAPTGRCKKNTALNIGMHLIQDTNDPPKIITSSLTPEALLKNLSVKTVGKSDAAAASTATIFATELATFLGKEKYKENMIPYLTKLYDCENSFDAETIGRGENVIKNPGVVLLAGTTPEWLQDSMSSYSLEGGFANRVNFIYMSKTTRCFPRAYSTPRLKQLRVKLIADLNEIKFLEGAVKLDDSAEHWFNGWYREWHTYINEHGEHDNIYSGRKDDMLNKLSMIIAVSQTGETTVSEEHYIRALIYIDEIRDCMNQSTKAQSILEKPTRYASDIAKIVRTISIMKPKDRSRINIEEKCIAFTRSENSFNSAFSFLLKTKQLHRIEGTQLHKNGRRGIKYHIGESNGALWETYFPEEVRSIRKEHVKNKANSNYSGTSPHSASDPAYPASS